MYLCKRLKNKRIQLIMLGFCTSLYAQFYIFILVLIHTQLLLQLIQVQHLRDRSINQKCRLRPRASDVANAVRKKGTENSDVLVIEMKTVFKATSTFSKVVIDVENCHARSTVAPNLQHAIAQFSQHFVRLCAGTRPLKWRNEDHGPRGVKHAVSGKFLQPGHGSADVVNAVLGTLGNLLSVGARSDTMRFPLNHGIICTRMQKQQMNSAVNESVHDGSSDLRYLKRPAPRQKQRTAVY
jgi:hypothetical protein